MPKYVRQKVSKFVKQKRLYKNVYTKRYRKLAGKLGDQKFRFFST